MKLLIIEDDPAVAHSAKTGLSAQGHTVEIATDGGEGSFMGRSFEYDAIVLDYGLPKKNGLEVCREIRAAGKTTPIIFLSVNDETDTKIQALDSGADDYMTKPFRLEELYSRLKAISRRPHEIKSSTITIDDLSLDSEKHLVKRGDVQIHMTRKEFSLLEYFMKNPGIVLSRALIMEHVWTADSNPFSNTVEAHIRNLRRKITVGDKPNLIANIPGRGYVLDTPANLARL